MTKHNAMHLTYDRGILSVKSKSRSVFVDVMTKFHRFCFFYFLFSFSLLFYCLAGDPITMKASEGSQLEFGFHRFSGEWSTT
jgi:hypothetical protein